MLGLMPSGLQCLTKVLPEQLGRYRPRDPFRILIEAEPFCYLGTGLQNVEQPHLLAAATIALEDRISRTITVDVTFGRVDHGARSQVLANALRSPPRLGIA